MIWWHGISVLGSMAVMAPAGMAIALLLAAAGAWHLLLRWCWLFAVGMALVVVSKLAFIGWGIGLSSIGFAGFSGHAMRAAAVLPVACYLLFKNSGATARQASLIFGVLLAVLISVSRVVLHAHSVSEVVSGCVLGLAVAFAFLDDAQGSRHFFLSRPLLALCACALLFTPQVEPVPTEAWLTQLALHLSGRVQPFTRLDWQRDNTPMIGAVARHRHTLTGKISP